MRALRSAAMATRAISCARNFSPGPAGLPPAGLPPAGPVPAARLVWALASRDSAIEVSACSHGRTPDCRRPASGRTPDSQNGSAPSSAPIRSAAEIIAYRTEASGCSLAGRARIVSFRICSHAAYSPASRPSLPSKYR
jgi:hypothetical protein